MNDRIPNEGYVYFGLRGTFDPDELTDRLGVLPTSSCTQGARNPERGLPKTAQWEFSTKRIVDECIDVYELADEIITALEPKTVQIRDVIADLKLYAVLEVVLYFSTDDEVSTPAIGFSNRVLTFLANVNASIDIDAYILPGKQSSSTQSPDEQTDAPERAGDRVGNGESNAPAR